MEASVQVALSIGIPTFAVLVGILLNRAAKRAGEEGGGGGGKKEKEEKPL